MAKTKHGVQETVGIFQVRGVVTGTEKDKFFNELKTKNNSDMRIVNFGVNVDKGKAVYLSLNGTVKDEVCFSKKDKEGKIQTKKVKWANRETFKEDGYNLIGVNLGLKKNDEGKNIKITKTEYDACEEISKLLKDDMSVFAKGKIDFSSFKDNSENVKRATKFIPQQISLTSKEIDFDDEGFQVKSDFKQQIIFMGIEKKDNYFVVSAKIATYSSIEDTEFIIKDDKLASLFKKNLKPYNAITVYGNISVEENIVEVSNDDCWGKEDPTNAIISPTKRELVITGATPSTIDKDTYSEKIIEEAIERLNQSQEAQEDWGKKNDTMPNDNDDDEW